MGDTAVVDDGDALVSVDRSRRPLTSTYEDAGEGGSAVVRPVGEEDDVDAVSTSAEWEV